MSSRKLKFEDECGHRFGDPELGEDRCEACGAPMDATGCWGQPQTRVEALCPVRLHQKLIDVRDMVDGSEDAEGTMLAFYEMFGLQGQ